MLPLDPFFVSPLEAFHSACAREAISHVKKKLYGGAPNEPTDKDALANVELLVFHGKNVQKEFDEGRQETSEAQKNFEKIQKDLNLKPKDPEYQKLYHDYLLILHMKCVDVAVRVGAGNCGEQSHVAYDYLTKNLNLTDVAIITVHNWNHTFIVIGDKTLVPGLAASGNSFSLDLSKPPVEWTQPGVVICDPWVEKVYPPEDWAQMVETINIACKGTPPQVGKMTIEFGKSSVVTATKK